MTEFTEIASGLRFPEGPIAMPDGSVIVVEMFGKVITRVLPDGSKQKIAGGQVRFKISLNIHTNNP